MKHHRSATDHRGTVEYIELGHLRGEATQKDAKIQTIEFVDSGSAKPSYDEEKKQQRPLESARDLVTEILTVEDDPTLVDGSYFNRF